MAVKIYTYTHSQTKQFQETWHMQTAGLCTPGLKMFTHAISVHRFAKDFAFLYCDIATIYHEILYHLS